MERILTHGSLFAGIGGFELGFQRQGFKTVWAVENDLHCQKLLKARFPGIQVFGDVKSVGRANLARVGVITYGFPCQDASALGLRAGLEKGKRTNLFYEAVRIINELRPAIAVGENVVGLLSADRGCAMPNIVRALASIGHHDICWDIVNARRFRLAQGRRRVFIVSTASPAHGSIAARPAFRILHQPGNATPASPPPPPKPDSELAGGDALERADFAVVSHATPGLTAYRWQDFPTLVTDGKYVMLADKGRGTLRYLTPLEFERLQGFPDDWTAGFPKTVRYKMVGNSVVPAVAEFVARGCRGVLTQDAIASAP